MGVLAYLILCAIVGVLTWVLITYVPMPAEIKRWIPVAAVLILVLILILQLVGGASDVPIPRLR